MTERSANLTLADLRQFTGTEQWYRHGLNRSVLYTDGVKYLAEHAGAYWLIDEIALAQRGAVAALPFQLWRLTVKRERGILTCEDGDGRKVRSKRIPFTDFPLPRIELYCIDNIILLPSEY